MKAPEEIAREIVEGLSFSSNRMLDGRFVGEQYFAHAAILDAINAERLEIVRLRDALHNVRCELNNQGTNNRLKASGHRRKALNMRDWIILILELRGHSVSNRDGNTKKLHEDQSQ